MNRRKFLIDASASALIAGSARFVQPLPAKAGMHGVNVVGFNGGKTQCGLYFPYADGNFAFLNMVKRGFNWVSQVTGNAVAPSDLDANGYPLSSAGVNVSLILQLPPSSVFNERLIPLTQVALQIVS